MPFPGATVLRIWTNTPAGINFIVYCVKAITSS